VRLIKKYLIKQQKLQSPNNIKVIISGGGTGGHIFPAIAIANALKALNPSVEILFVGAEGKMEMEKVPAAGYKIEGLPIAGIKRELSLDNLSFPFKLLKSLNKAGSVMKNFNPDVAVGVGGYASGPMLFTASRKGVPTLIQEQNSYPGITNKILSKKAAKVCVAYENMDRFFEADKIIFTGNPVREDIKHIDGKKFDACKFFGLDPEKPTLLVVGGSQGARSINRAMKAGLKQINDAGVQLIWQTGKLFFSEAKEAVESLNVTSLHAFDFISKMDLAYAAADAVVARAGASTVSELCIVKKPAILVPLPTAAEDHQTKNCIALVERKAALLVNDSEASTILVNNALDLIANASQRKSLSDNIAVMARPDAAQQIAKEVLRLARK
jgi:UDP-N-acetylglucosamine--N-acetylmuramyl-(pentapeptide) pyrophosphoryl-undecaprenol N-acetylglucosamine transferase